MIVTKEMLIEKLSDTMDANNAARFVNAALQTVRSTTLDEVAIWLEGFEFPEAKLLAKQARIMAKDALE